MQLVCPSCGTENPPDRERCFHCAALLAPPEPAPETPAPGEKPRRRRRWLLLILAFLALCLVAALLARLGAEDREATPTPSVVAQATERAEAAQTAQPEELFGPFRVRWPDFAAYFERVSNDVTTELDNIVAGLGRVAEGVMEGLTGWLR
jgi:hypothetical protein